MIITDRDIKIFKFINKFGLVKKGSILKEYNVSKSGNFAKRLRALEKEKYLKSVGQAFALGINGISELALIGEKNNYSRVPSGDAAKRIYKDADVLLNLNFKKCMSKIECINLEKEEGRVINSVRTFAGKVWDDENNKYLVYRIDNFFTKKNYTYLCTDTEKSRINKVILVINDTNLIDKLKYFFKKSRLKEVLVILNNTFGFKLIEMYRFKKLSCEFIKKYIQINSDKKIEMKNNKLYFEDKLIQNSLILDLIKERNFSFKVNKLNLECFGFVFLSCYRDFFISENFKKNFKVRFITISIDSEKFSKFLFE